MVGAYPWPRQVRVWVRVGWALRHILALDVVRELVVCVLLFDNYSRSLMTRQRFFNKRCEVGRATERQTQACCAKGAVSGTLKILSMATSESPVTSILLVDFSYHGGQKNRYSAVCAGCTNAERLH